MKESSLTDKKIRQKTITSFVVFFLFIAACIFGWKWLHRQPESAGTPRPLRAALDMNERLFSKLVDNNNLSKTFPRSAAVKNVRVNGDAGMSANFDTAAWRLQVIRKPGDTLRLTLSDIKALPKTEVIFDFKCIEGWSQVTHWGGVRFSDFAKHYGLQWQTGMAYSGLRTPDNGYYVGIDNRSMLHPQTILCYEMNDAPLPMNQGYPLRLIIPVKYGIKHIKRIGTLFFSDQRPPDYWYERGYDYFSGL
jgi:DMSO/TMAO reductase YedYZ molybdopterin-dependent catalytic subunit